MSASNCQSRYIPAQPHLQQQQCQQRNPVCSVQNQRYDQHYGATVGTSGCAVEEFDCTNEEYVGSGGRFVNANNCNEPTDHFDVCAMDNDGGTLTAVPTTGSIHQATRSWHGIQTAPENKHSLRYVASEPHSVGKRNLVVTQAQVYWFIW
jgi:hypothetical protein